MLVTITSPVMAHNNCIPKVALIETRACSLGVCVLELAAAIPAVPRPDSFVNKPLAMPYLAAVLLELATNHPWQP